MKLVFVTAIFMLLGYVSTAQSYKEEHKEIKEMNKRLKKPTKEAEKGNLEAILKLADFYWTGVYEGEDHRSYSNLDASFRYYKMAADAGSPAGYCGLAVWYNRQRYMDANYDSAFKYFRKAIAAGYVPALIKLGALYEKGKVIAATSWTAPNTPLPPQLDSAIFYYTKAAEMGADSMYCFIGNIFQSSPEEDKRKQALSWYQKAADKGYAPAVEMVANYSVAAELPYERGLAAIAAGKDSAALKLFTIAAQINYDSRAMIKLGRLYGKNGLNDEQAMYWYQKASSLGSAEASNMVGWNYYVRRQFTEAYTAFNKAIEQGYAGASYDRDLASKGYAEKAADDARRERRQQELRDEAVANAANINPNTTAPKIITVKWCYECDGTGKIFNTFGNKKLSSWHICGACYGKGYTK
jgi:TPR repeat protein